MQTHIAQAAALTIHGNHFLQGHGPGGFWPDSTVFGFCRTVRFVSLVGAPGQHRELAHAEDPMLWLARLKGEGTLGLRLHHAPSTHAPLGDRMSVAFEGGGGRWLVENVRGKSSDFWEARWEGREPDGPDTRIWEVTYGRVGAATWPVPLEEHGIARLREELEETLAEIAGFAERQGLESFAASFRGGLEQLHAEAPLSGVYHSDIAPSGALTLGAAQLLGVAQTAWVFGGMGSWNDLGFEGRDQETYDRLSNRLFGLLNRAIVEAANSSFASRPERVERRPWWRLW